MVQWFDAQGTVSVEKPRSKLFPLTFVFSEKSKHLIQKSTFVPLETWEMRRPAGLLQVALNDVTVPWPLCSSGVSTERKMGHRAETAVFGWNCITLLNCRKYGDKARSTAYSSLKVCYCCIRTCELPVAAYVGLWSCSMQNWHGTATLKTDVDRTM